MGYDKLERNLIDIIKEEQAKLGFFREDIHLYYPLSSLNHFFSAKDSADEMQERLNTLPASITEKLGQIEVSHKGNRFCFHIPKEGTVYVHDMFFTGRSRKVGRKIPSSSCKCIKTS